MTVAKHLGREWGNVSLLQLVIGATLAVAGVAAILRLADIWSVTEVKYTEYSLILAWGVLLMIGAVRSR